MLQRLSAVPELPVNVHSLQAPTADGAVLADPPLGELETRLDHNRRLLNASHILLLGRPLSDLRREAMTAAIDVARAKENGVSVIRADVAGRTADRVSYGSSWIVDPGGTVLRAARPLTEDFLIAEIDTTPRGRQRGPSVQFDEGQERP